MLSIRSGSSLHAERPSPSQVEWGSVDGPGAVSIGNRSPRDAERSPTVPTSGRASSGASLLQFYAGEGWTWTEERRSTYSVLRVKWLGAYAP